MGKETNCPLWYTTAFYCRYLDCCHVYAIFVFLPRKWKL